MARVDEIVFGGKGPQDQFDQDGHDDDGQAVGWVHR